MKPESQEAVISARAAIVCKWRQDLHRASQMVHGKNQAKQSINNLSVVRLGAKSKCKLTVHAPLGTGCVPHAILNMLWIPTTASKTPFNSMFEKFQYFKV